MEDRRNSLAIRRFVIAIILVVVISVAALALLELRKPPLTIAEVSLMAVEPTHDRSPGATANELHAAGTSSTVLRRAAQTLSLMNVSIDPTGLARAIRAKPIPGTHRLAIEAVSPDPEEARAAAETAAAETVISCRQLTGSSNAEVKRPGKALCQNLPRWRLETVGIPSAAIAGAGIVLLLGLSTGRRFSRTERGGVNRAMGWIVAVTLLVVVASAATLAALMLRPTRYEAAAKMMAPGPRGTNRPLGTSAKELVRIITRQEVSNRAAKNLALLGFKVEPRELLRSISAERIPGTRMVKVTAVGGNGQEAKALAEQVAVEAQKLYVELTGASGDSVKVIDEAYFTRVNNFGPLAISALSVAGAGVLLLVGLLAGRRCSRV